MWSELNDLNERLSRASDQKARLSKLQNRVAELEREYREIDQRVRQFRAAAAREDADVERLQGLSLSGLFYSVLGSKEEQMYKERQEALAAHLKADEAAKRQVAIGQELARSRAELASAQSSADYDALLREKEAVIQRSTGSGAAHLLRFGEQEQQCRWQFKELQEAYTAGQQADGALAAVENCLGSAQGWGAWDMLGGGLIATAIKHSRIDEARSHVARAQQALDAFQRELKDVSMMIRVDNIQIGSFATFADFFFDGLIADWIVQSRINQSLESARQARYQVRSLLQTVYQRLQQVQAQIGQIQQERAAFIAGYQG